MSESTSESIKVYVSLVRHVTVDVLCNSDYTQQVQVFCETSYRGRSVIDDKKIHTLVEQLLG